MGGKATFKSPILMGILGGPNLFFSLQNSGLLTHLILYLLESEAEALYIDAIKSAFTDLGFNGLEFEGKGSLQRLAAFIMPFL